MIAFPSQSKIATNPWISIIVDNTGRNNKINYNVIRIDKERNQKISTKKYNSNITSCALNQDEGPPLFEMFLNFLMGATLIIIAYILYSVSIGSFSVADFLQYILILEQKLKGSRDLAISLSFWVGVAIIMLMVWGKKRVDLGPVAVISCLIIFIIVILPVILLWWLWPFNILDKFIWMAGYFTMLRFMTSV